MLDPQLAVAYKKHGDSTYSEKDQYDLAISDFTKAIELAPQDANAYYKRGVAYSAKGGTR